MCVVCLWRKYSFKPRERLDGPQRSHVHVHDEVTTFMREKTTLAFTKPVGATAPAPCFN